MSAKQNAALERLRRARQRRNEAADEFNAALVLVAQMKTRDQSWRMIGDAAGMTPQGVINALERLGEHTRVVRDAVQEP